RREAAPADYAARSASSGRGPPIESTKSSGDEAAMRPDVRAQYEAFPEPSPGEVPIDARQLDRLDDGLHFGWAWHRHRYCYRRADHLRILDAGCGTGVTTLGLARLNPGATVVGLDGSPRSLDLARQRAEVAGMPTVGFRAHDLDEPLPGDLGGPFDFIV